MALSQLRGAEPATWHWASYVALSQQGSFELWASKEAVSQQGSFELHHHHIYIYIPMQSQAYNILNLGKNFFEGDTYLWAGAGMWNLPFDTMGYLKMTSRKAGARTVIPRPSVDPFLPWARGGVQDDVNGFWESLRRKPINFPVYVAVWRFGTMEFYDFPSGWECHDPNWRSPSFFRGVGFNHQPGEVFMLCKF